MMCRLTETPTTKEEKEITQKKENKNLTSNIKTKNNNKNQCNVTETE